MARTNRTKTHLENLVIIPNGSHGDTAGDVALQVGAINSDPLGTVATKFSVSEAGNTVVAGTLQVTGASTLTGNTGVTGTLDVTGATTLGALSTFKFGSIVSKADSYALQASDVSGTWFLATTKACTFTLPAASAGNVGKWYGFIDTADFDMVIGRNGSQTLIADGLATAVSVTFGTTSHKIGSACIALCVSATQWAVINIGATTATVG